MVHIVVEDVWKSFRIYEERAHSLKEVLLVRRSSYESFWALQDVSIDAYDGEMVGVIGPNGSGKSTLLKIIARIYTANRGNISIQGKLSAMLELGVGFHPELSGHDNVYLAGSLAGLSTADIDSRYADIVEFAGIPDFMDSAVKNFSSGMFARLAFALAMDSWSAPSWVPASSSAFRAMFWRAVLMSMSSIPAFLSTRSVLPPWRAAPTSTKPSSFLASANAIWASARLLASLIAEASNPA